MGVRVTSDGFPRESFVPIYVIRHAEAGDRDGWSTPDRARPLTQLGVEQAAMRAALLGDLPLVSLVSSPYARCIETFEPLARYCRLGIGTNDLLAEGGTSEPAIDLLVELAERGPSAVCTHGDVMVRTIGKLLDDGVQIATEAPVGFEKGCTWVLEFHSGTVISARYLPVPRVHHRRYQASTSLVTP
jgi:broad specificity phosphatase PhoE